ncbi:histidine kinase [Belliella baltica DSM 15883]|uniref:histidine kinase n=1 Tax=Belliella baltica (strain DSM 15883 / CIP 108006 / LMG 21964 / BA134) TaxID=866536 RepID=I3Z227_BELBD|nr:ATP-binding protein [Belliella baltica]AFL83295.1 histidine kinase [Belliella baltica DSM 15883]
MENEGSNIFLLILFGSLLTLLMAGFIVTMVLIHRSRQIKNKQKLESLKAEFEKTILNVEKEIQEETLNHVGRELHDNIGQLLSLTKLTLNNSKPEKIQEGKQLVNQVIKEVRNLSKSLNLDWVATVDLDVYIQKELGKLERLEFCKVEYERTGEPIAYENSKKLVLIRVIQECLNNAIKHAKPEIIKIKLDYYHDFLEVSISDDGIGFDTNLESAGSGMNNLKSRMKTIGGTIEIHSELKKGTQIKLLLPNSNA